MSMVMNMTSETTVDTDESVAREPAAAATDTKARTKLAEVVVVTSGKGGVGKTTTSANIATGIALLGHKTIAIDFDVGLRNLELIIG
jgi:Mrp family chromosome partitioning ATPase